MKKLFYATLITLLGALCLVIKEQNSSYSVLKVNSNDTFVIDFNKNDIAEVEELYILPNLKIITNPSESLSKEEAFILNELSKNFAREFFFNKKIKLDKNNEILANGINYKNKFYDSGFNYEQNPEKYNELVKLVFGKVK